MEQLHHVVVIGPQNRAGINRLLASLPMVPQPGEGEQLAVSEPDAERLLLVVRLLPLEETVGDHQAAMMVKQTTESRFRGGVLGWSSPRSLRRMASVWRDSGLLAGKRLIPFWRGREPRGGANLRRIFTEPRPFDLVLWAQGTAATPYLEEGTLTKPEVWDRLRRVFGGELMSFAIWFN